MEMLRSFLPVGQGAFYSERFFHPNDHNIINVIYDCGSLENIKLVNRQIEFNFRPGEHIDAVFLSHLDEDHINGLPFLLKHCTVKNIFLPFLTSEVKDYLKIYNMLYARGLSAFSVEFSNNPREALERLGLPELPHIYTVDPFDLSESFADRDDRNDRDDLNFTKISSGRDVFSMVSTSAAATKPEWQYIPFNFRQNSRVQVLESKLEKEFGRIPSSEELVNMWPDKDCISKLKKAYAGIRGSFNANSMIVYSGPQSMIHPIMRACCKLNCDECILDDCCLPMCFWSGRSGCVYMGDYEAAGERKWEEFDAALSSYQEEIGLIQVPHHGSRYNFNPKLIRKNCQYIISAGTKNRFGHPHGSVLKALLLQEIHPYIVTEQCSSRRDYWIHW